MGELPCHVLLKVLDYLPTVEAIRYRSVCKSWRTLIDQFVLDELNLFYEQKQCSKYLQFRKCFTNPNRSISFNKSSFGSLVIDNEQFAFLFKNLKKFAYQQAFEWKTNIAKLEKLTNTFVNLEHLYLVGTSLISIKLAKLKTFDCSYFNENRNAREGSKLLDCPKLQALAIDWEETDEPVLNCPKLRYLKYVHYSPWVSRLDSLEVLNLREFRTNSADILSNHPKLHTLNVFSVEKAELQELFRSKRELRRGHLKVFIKSLPVDGEVLEAFDEVFRKGWMHLGRFTAKGVEFYVKHEQEFRDDFYVFDEYNRIVINNKETFTNLKLLTDRTPIFKKIRRAHAVDIKARDSFSQDELLNLLKQMPSVIEFKCLAVALDQTFFNQLPTILKHLQILWASNNTIGLSDYSFILRYRELWYFVPEELSCSDENWQILTEFEKRQVLDFHYKIDEAEEQRLRESMDAILASIIIEPPSQ